MTNVLDRTVIPGDREGEDASRLRILAEVLDGDDALTVSNGYRTAAMPDEVRRLLQSILADLTAGSAVTVAAQRTQLTTQEAADMLGVSRPTLVRLLTGGEIPYTRPGRHRRILLTDLLAYQQAMAEQRAAALTALSEPEPPTTSSGSGFTTTR